MIRAFVGIGILLILLSTLVLLLPHIINLGPVKERILIYLSQKAGGRVNFQKVDISYFPYCRVVVHHPSFSIPGKVTGTLVSATVSPEVFSLLRGKIRISRIQIEAPNITLMLPEKPWGKEKKTKALSLGSLGQLMTPILGLMEFKLPNLDVQVVKGKLNLLDGTQSLFWFQDIQAKMVLPPQKLTIDLTCQSNLWQNIHVEGRIDSRTLTLQGRIDLTAFRPNVLSSYLALPIPLRVGDSRTDLKLRFKTDGHRSLQAEVQGSIPFLTLRRGDKKLVLKGGKLAGHLTMDRDKSEISIAHLILEEPRISIAGKLQIDSTIPFLKVEVEGKEIDLISTSQALSALIGDVPPVQKILEVVRGGQIPLVLFRAQGRSLDELGKLENLFIQGNIREGKAFISERMVGVRGLNLALGRIKGNVRISKGFLEAKNLEARWGKKARVEEGLLRWNLAGKGGRFHLEATSEVDLAPIPPLLKKLVKDENILRGIELIREMKGRVRGRWVLGETLKAIRLKADVREINLFARYARIPYPLVIQSGQVSYGGEKVGITRLNAKLGRSSLSGFTARLDLKAGPHLEILSGESALLLDEIFPWLSSLEKFKGATKGLKSLKGMVALSSLEWKGPLFDPESCRFRIGGEVENMSIDLTLLPGPVFIPGAKFEITPEKISLSDARVGILDASLRAEGVLHDYQRGLERMAFTIQADIGSKIIEWVWDRLRLPEKLRVRPLSVAQSHVAWERNGKTSFIGNIAVREGARIFIDMLHQSEEFTINRMLIQDQKSKAALALSLHKRDLRIDFTGNLEKATLDRFLVENEIFKGRLKGDFHAHVLIDNPLGSMAQGKLQVAGLDYPLPLHVPVTLNQFSLEGAEQKIIVESASFAWDDKHLVLNGDVKFSTEDFLLDIEVNADGLKWEKIEKELKIEHQKKDGLKPEKQGSEEQKIDSPKDKKAQLPPVKGKIRVKLKYFEYENYVLEPLYADFLLEPDGIKVVIHDTNLCGISMPGVVKFMLPDISLDFQPVSRDQELKKSLECLLREKVGMNGSFNFQGKFKGRAEPHDLLQALQGNFELEAKKGQMNRESTVIKVLTVLNITEFFFGENREFMQKGAPYDSINVQGNLQGGKFIMKELIMNAPWMKMVSEGEIDLIHQKIDLTLILVPLKTVNQLVRRIPILGYILGDYFISIPVRVRGDLNDPGIIPLSPSAIGSGLLGVMKRTLTFPYKLIQPIMPRSEEE